MKIAIFGRVSNKNALAPFKEMFRFLMTCQEHTFYFYEPLAEFIHKQKLELKPENIFTDPNALQDIDYIVSIGGDGTLLETITFIGKRNIPILGINAGRLGFLATVPIQENIIESLTSFFNKEFTVEERDLVELQCEGEDFDGFPYGLNEIAIQKRDSSSMILIHSYIDGEFLNSYWADGLIISTPTGSTGYSLSCGGPLVIPQSDNFIISPLNPHNLNVRPMVVPSDSCMTFSVEGRTKNILLSMDSRSKNVRSNVQINIKKADFRVKLVKLNNVNFFDTLRKKLNWGLDVRN